MLCNVIAVVKTILLKAASLSSSCVKYCLTLNFAFHFKDMSFYCQHVVSVAEIDKTDYFSVWNCFCCQMSVHLQKGNLIGWDLVRSYFRNKPGLNTNDLRQLTY